MEPPLDELYFTWLYTQVDEVVGANPSVGYWGLLRELHVKEFVWLVGNDDNRAEDGRDLRQEFFVSTGVTCEDEYWTRMGCSMLELMIALARRMAFEAGRDAEIWFWMLIDNLELTGYTDSRRTPKDKIGDILDRVIWRTYEENGRGGLFPLRGPHKDQREVEIWYQLQSYLLEHGY